MSTKINTHSASDTRFIQGLKIGVVVADWNSEITNKLLAGAIDRLKEIGYTDNDIRVFHVPGSVELTFAASQLIKNDVVSGVIVLGCVIRGETSHYDYVCKSITDGVTQLNLLYDIPVAFGVLTVENQQQALDRAGGNLGNKGSECADVVLKMCELRLMVQE